MEQFRNIKDDADSSYIGKLFNKQVFLKGKKCESADEWLENEVWQKAWFEKIEEYAKRGKIDLILTKSISRFAGNTEDKNKFQQTQNEIRKLEDRISKLVQMKIDGEISQEDFKREYSALCEIKNKHIEIKNSYIEKEIDDNEKLRQVSIIREIINTNSNPLTEFDDSIFKAIVDKVIVRTPVSFSFILINGMEFAIDGREYSYGRKFKTREY